MASSESEAAADVPSSNSAAQDAKARREARKARILGAGSDRLARITKTGRGSEANELYASPGRPLGGGGSAASGPSPSAGVPISKIDVDEDEVLQRANAALRGSTGQDDDDDPQDVDISQGAQSNPFMAMMTQQQGAGTSGQAGDMPQDMQGFMQAMQQAMMGGQQPGMAGNGKAGGGMEGNAPFPFPFPPPGQGQPGAATATEPAPPSLLDAVFNIMRALVFIVFGIALAYGALTSGHAQASRVVSKSAGEAIVEKFEHMTKLHRWARLAYERPAHWESRYFGIESFGLPFPVQDVPVFWILITLEIGLASMRIMLQRRRPQPPGLLLKVASFIPNANIQLAIRALAAYLPLLDAFINDLALVVFTIGCAVMFAAWKVGLDPLLAPSDGSVSNAAVSLGFERLAEVAQDVASNVAGASSNVFEAAAPPM